jgi:hypothetical protein
MLRCLALVTTHVLEECIASIIRVEKISELGTTLAVSSLLILFTLMMEAIGFSNTSELTRATSSNIPQDGILHSHGLENLKS